LNGAYGDYLERAKNANNSVMMMDPLILPENHQAHISHAIMPHRPDTLIMNEGAVNTYQDNILRVNSMEAVLFPDSF
jgi:hypothetical protein